MHADHHLSGGVFSGPPCKPKNPDADVSIPLELEIFDQEKTFNEASDFMKFTSSVASFSMLLSDSEYKGTSNYDTILEWLNATNLNDEYGFKAEFKELVKTAKNLN